MAKGKHSSFVCSSCGNEEPKWLGRCPSCGEWNTLKEFHIPASTGSARSRSDRPASRSAPLPLASIDPSPPQLHPTGNPELDRVLGGGLAPGAAVLLGGEPGIGKSTLMLQVAATLPGRGLYVSGEESPEQVKSRADRLELQQDSLDILCETNLDALMLVLENHKPAYLVVDSVQTLVSGEAGAVPGTPNQLKMAGFRLTEWAKSSGSPVILIAHVTKEGFIAGPKLIEHLVDTVLYFDHASGDLRILRASKNRMGSVDEVGLFHMSAKGLHPISDPAGIFLQHRDKGPPPGSVVAAVYEGSRILLVEIQALTIPAKAGIGRVYSDRIDAGRVSRVAAVLERHGGVRLSDQDLYVNVAGGLRVIDTGTELALALSLFSARTEQALPANLIAVGELTLAGEIREVPHQQRRIKTAVETGFTRWMAAGTGKGRGHNVKNIREALAAALEKPIPEPVDFCRGFH